MEPSFWIDRWQQRQIGFHQQDVNAYLREHWPQFDIPRDAAVFVPLCGKTRDMQWLHAHGHSVIGIELARIAIEEFFAELALAPRISRDERFETFIAPGYTLICGDFFALESHDLQGVRAVFDRAALVALPTPMRERYVEKLATLIPGNAETLLVAVTYPQEQMSGPPFSVGEAEVRRLYEPCKVDKLVDVDILDYPENARFKERGLRQLSEQVYRVRSR